MPEARLRLATWNVHGFVGSDGQRDPQRAVEVLREIGPDLVALQEVDARSSSDSDCHPLDVMASGLEATAVAGPTLGSPGRDYGNAVLSRLPIIEVHRHDISRPGVEPRGALDIRARHDDHTVRFVAVHLGLRRAERIAQVSHLVARLQPLSRNADIVAVAGDLNAWWPRAREARVLERTVGPSPKPRTFPSKRPLFRLDRIFVRPPGAINDWGVARDAGVRAVSDHLPLWVDLVVGADEEAQARRSDTGGPDERS